jgi:hypothetical protein
MRGDDLLDRTAQLDPARAEQYEVITDAFEIGEDVRREHDGQPAVGYRKPVEQLGAGIESTVRRMTGET